MTLPKDSVYGFVSDETIEGAIEKKLRGIDARKPEKIAQALSEAVAALLAINSAIPVNSKHRHLIAGPLESFADDGETS